MTILLGAMLMATGHPVRLVLAGFRQQKRHGYSHIYPEVNRRRQLDCARRHDGAAAGLGAARESGNVRARLNERD